VTSTAGSGSAQVIWRATYEPFGLATPDEDPDGDSQSFALDLRFPGQVYDVESSLHYNYFRDYDARSGRYLEADPIGLGGGTNLYAYASGIPIEQTDPRGLSPFTYGRPTPGMPTVVCNGSGGIIPHIPKWGDPYDRCLRDCVRQHEVSHIVDIRAIARRTGSKPCSGKAHGVSVGIYDTVLYGQSEYRGHSSEIACLRRKLESVSDCDECKPVLLQRLNRVQQERQRFRDYR
jgi:RHS repeat-associated protein